MFITRTQHIHLQRFHKVSGQLLETIGEAMKDHESVLNLPIGTCQGLLAMLQDINTSLFGSVDGEVSKLLWTLLEQFNLLDKEIVQAIDDFKEESLASTQEDEQPFFQTFPFYLSHYSVFTRIESLLQSRLEALNDMIKQGPSEPKVWYGSGTALIEQEIKRWENGEAYHGEKSKAAVCRIVEMRFVKPDGTSFSFLREALKQTEIRKYK